MPQGKAFVEGRLPTRFIFGVLILTAASMRAHIWPTQNYIRLEQCKLIYYKKKLNYVKKLISKYE